MKFSNLGAKLTFATAMQKTQPQDPKPAQRDSRTSPLVIIAALLTGYLAMGAGQCQFNPVNNTTPFELAIAESDLEEAEAELAEAQRAYDERKAYDKELKNAKKELKEWTGMAAVGFGNDSALAKWTGEVLRLTALGFTYEDKATLKARLRAAEQKVAAARKKRDRCRSDFDAQNSARDVARQGASNAARTGTSVRPPTSTRGVAPPPTTRAAPTTRHR